MGVGVAWAFKCKEREEGTRNKNNVCVCVSVCVCVCMCVCKRDGHRLKAKGGGVNRERKRDKWQRQTLDRGRKNNTVWQTDRQDIHIGNKTILDRPTNNRRLLITSVAYEPVGWRCGMSFLCGGHIRTLARQTGLSEIALEGWFGSGVYDPRKQRGSLQKNTGR